MDTLTGSFLRYASGNILGMLGISCYILADTYFIATGVGSDGLTALNLVIPVYSLISGCGLMIGSGAATRYAIARGAGHEARARRAFTRGILLALLFGLICTAAGVLFAFDLARLLGAEGEILALAGEYLRTMCAFSLAFIFNNVLLAFVRNDGAPGLAMAGMVLGSLSNVLLDYLFIFPCGLGMFGAAFATGCSPIISLLILSLHKLRGHCRFGFGPIPAAPASFFRILSTGLSALIGELSSGIIMLFFNYAILGLTGNIGVAAYGIIANLALIVVAIFTGLGQGIQPLISRATGAGDPKAVGRILRLALVTAAAAGMLCCAAGILCAEPVVAAFNRDADPLLATIAVEGMRLYSLAFLLMGPNLVMSAVFSAMARPLPAFLISMTRALFAVLPLLLLLASWLGMTGVWLVIPAAELITLGLTLLLARRYLPPSPTENPARPA